MANLSLLLKLFLYSQLFYLSFLDITNDKSKDALQVIQVLVLVRLLLLLFDCLIKSRIESNQTIIMNKPLCPKIYELLAEGECFALSMNGINVMIQSHKSTHSFLGHDGIGTIHQYLPQFLQPNDSSTVGAHLVVLLCNSECFDTFDRTFLK